MDLKYRMKKYITKNKDFAYSYFATFINDRLLSKMQKLADKEKLVEHYINMKHGLIENRSEKRMALHHLLRSNGENLHDKVKKFYEFYKNERERCYAFADAIKNSKYQSFVQVGVGGSILGAKFLFKALADCTNRVKADYNVEFIANIDKQTIYKQLDKLDLSKTLFIFATKSGSTKEIEIDEKIILSYIKENKDKVEANYNLFENSVLITSVTSPLSESKLFKEKFFIDNNIGGRFSISSPMGILINAIVYGKDACDSFLLGMRCMDENATCKNICDNAPLVSALINYYEQKKFKIEQNISSPYSEGLRDFPQYLSQLFMESLGKDKNNDGKRVRYRTGQFFFGDRGIACQHSFYQMLHNGTASASIEFIAFGNKDALCGNCFAQSIALFARNKENPNRKVTNKILYFDNYTPFEIGQVVSFYENKVMFLGFLYKINSYDQQGVEFGKKLYREIESGKNEEISFLFNCLENRS